MKKVFFILFFSFFFSCSSSQTNTEFKLQRSFPIELGDNRITEKDYFHFSTDSSHFNYILFHSYGKSDKKLMIDSIEGSSLLYGSTLYSFKSEKDNSHVVLWKNENEFFPSFNTYYIKDGKLTKIGKWLVYTPCQSCDFQDYPIEGIRIFRKGDEIEFTFVQDAYYSEGNDSGWTLYKAGDLKLSFNIINGLLRNTSM